MTMQFKREIGRIGVALIVSAISIPVGYWAWSVEEKAEEHNRKSIEISMFAHESSDDIQRAMAEAKQGYAKATIEEHRASLIEEAAEESRKARAARWRALTIHAFRWWIMLVPLIGIVLHLCYRILRLGITGTWFRENSAWF
ncbi:MAG: hypothetical protein ACYSX0_07155 [Planctomycetota bacterium]|jgi:hypothetical protein